MGNFALGVLIIMMCVVVFFIMHIEEADLSEAFAADYYTPKPYIPGCQWTGRQFNCPAAAIYKVDVDHRGNIIIQPK